jgi:hypothetical protein
MMSTIPQAQDLSIFQFFLKELIFYFSWHFKLMNFKNKIMLKVYFKKLRLFQQIWLLIRVLHTHRVIKHYLPLTILINKSFKIKYIIYTWICISFWVKIILWFSDGIISLYFLILTIFSMFILCIVCKLVNPSPTKLRRDIVTLPSVLP